jgi:hypothetical protein
VRHVRLYAWYMCRVCSCAVKCAKVISAALGDSWAVLKTKT